MFAAKLCAHGPHLCKDIHINDTQTMPNINIKADERTPVKSTSAPNMIGRTKPPSPPASPTTPETTPIFFGYSSEIYLKTDALPMANAMPMVNMMAVKVTGLSPDMNGLRTRDGLNRHIRLRVREKEQTDKADPEHPPGNRMSTILVR